MEARKALARLREIVEMLAINGTTYFELTEIADTLESALTRAPAEVEASGVVVEKARELENVEFELRLILVGASIDASEKNTTPTIPNGVLCRAIGLLNQFREICHTLTAGDTAGGWTGDGWRYDVDAAPYYKFILGSYPDAAIVVRRNESYPEWKSCCGEPVEKPRAWCHLPKHIDTQPPERDTAGKDE